MLQFGNKHGGNAVNCRTFFLLDGLQDLERVEDFHRDHGGAMGHAGHDRQNGAKAVEKWNRNAESVPVGELHAFANVEAVVDQVVMGEHDPLGKAGSAGGVLHVDDIMPVQGRLNPCQFAVGHLFPHGDDLFKVDHAGGCFFADEHHGFENRQLRTVEFPCFGGCQFRHHLVQRGHIIGVLPGIDHEEGGGIGLFKKILQLRRLVSGVDRYQNGADLGACELQYNPLRDVVGPDGDVVTFFDSHGKEPLGDLPAEVAELPVAVAEAPFRIDQGVISGEFSGDIFQQSAYGKFNLLRHQSTSEVSFNLN